MEKAHIRHYNQGTPRPTPIINNNIFQPILKHTIKLMGSNIGSAMPNYANPTKGVFLNAIPIMH
jgi:hypothetical protein